MPDINNWEVVSVLLATVFLAADAWLRRRRTTSLPPPPSDGALADELAHLREHVAQGVAAEAAAEVTRLREQVAESVASLREQAAALRAEQRRQHLHDIGLGLLILVIVVIELIA